MKAGGNFYYYDYAGRIINAKQQKPGGGFLDLVTYAYTPDGQRIMKKNPNTYPYTTYYPTKNYEQTDAGGILIRLYLGNQEIATVDERPWTNLPPDRRYIHADNLGSARVITNQNGAMVELMYYEPFGVMSLLQQFSGPPYYDEKRKFTGHFHDDETGLEYMQARYYTAGWGRFMAEDPVFVAIGSSAVTGAALSKLLADPQALNSYTYARNNPLRYTDPDGKFWEEIGDFISGAGGAVMNNFSGGLVQNTYESNSGAYGFGKTTGNVLSVVAGAIETAAGAVETILSAGIGGGGLAFCAVTGAGCAVLPGTSSISVAGIAGGTAMAVHGGNTVGNAVNNLTKGNSGGAKMLGENGPQIDSSKTVGQGKGWHVDIENAAPGERPGNVHYQEFGNKGVKYLYDHEKNLFKYQTGEYLSKSQNKQLLGNSGVMKAVNKGLKMLGE